jgi:hypothetical protein
MSTEVRPSKDVLQRLRDSRHDVVCPCLDLRDAAAAEIERLRAALERLTKACEDYQSDKIPGAVWDEEVERARAFSEAAPPAETPHG